MKLIVLGSGAPPPDPCRSAPSALVEEGGRVYLFDCGEGTTVRLQQAEIALADVETIFFTHLHADHSLGYGQLLLGGWILGRRSLRVFGPVGLRHLHETLLTDLYRDDLDYRLGLGRGPAGLTEEVVIEELTGEGQAFRDERVTITYLPVVHSIATLAFRIDAASGASVVISGDTAYHEPLAEFARGTDVLLHDAVMSPSAMFNAGGSRAGEIAWTQMSRVHTTPSEAARIAALADARSLVLTHFVPGTNTGAAVAACRPHFDGPVWPAADLLEIDAATLNATPRAMPVQSH
ncbi:MAG: MBL fold metallo-hydrolase [Gaiellaceae bacterium MAG52_C11]|nr:MBL fold metallo-hydrolase [Candidatus Gaiellasilicea maunaloa]